MRNQTLDLIKIVAALFVVMIHYNNVSGKGGELYTFLVNGFARFAVPFFFMTTGFFLPKLYNSKKNYAFLKKLIKITVISTLFYLGYFILCSLIDTGSISISKSNILFWVIYNDCPFAAHIWYLYALIYALIILFIGIYFMNRTGLIRNWETINRGCIILLIFFIIFSEYTNSFFVRNFISGVACILLGVELYRFTKLKRKIGSNWLFTGVILNLTELIFIVLFFGEEVRQNVYITSLLLSAILILYSTSNCNVFNISRLVVGGGNVATLIFILHVFIGDILLRFISRETIVSQISFPFIVFILSYGLSLLIIKVRIPNGEKKLA